MQSKTNYLKLYRSFFHMHLRACMEYKMSFLLLTLGQLTTSFAAFFAIYFLFNRFQSVEGYSFSEVLLCYSTMLFAFSLAEIFFRGFDLFASVIKTGGFDQLLLRPQPAVFSVLVSKIEFTRAGRLVQALIIVAYVVFSDEALRTPLHVLSYLSMILGGVLLFGGLFIIYASLCFFTIEGLEFINIFTDGGRELGTYPLDVYGSRALLRFFTCIVPLACVQYYPFQFLIGRTDNLLYLFAPFASVIFLIPCLILWRFGVKKYQSTGS